MVSYRNRQTYFRSKEVILTERDELAFSRVLREFEPGVQFFNRDGDRVSPARNIPHCIDDPVSIELPAPDQKRQWRINLETRSRMVRPWVQFTMERSKMVWPDPSKKWAFDPPLLCGGRLTVGFPKDTPELKPLAMKLLRIANKVTWKTWDTGLDARHWSQSGGHTRRAVGVGVQIPKDPPVKFNTYYDDALWDDCLPDEPTGVRV